tara:strand:- start:101 stop:964 length:864 start_codon:yes stop_codon:yes gene_type:complete
LNIKLKKKIKLWIGRTNSLLPTIFLFPFLYFLGWFLVQMPGHYLFQLDDNQTTILGTLFSFLVFCSCLPFWIRYRWMKSNYLFQIGLVKDNYNFEIKKSFLLFLKGLLLAIFLIFLIIIFLFKGSWIKFDNYFSWAILLNAIGLVVGVGFAEELIFRSWLFGEMNLLVGIDRGIIAQSFIFSFVHFRFDYGLNESITFHLGLFLLGYYLGLRRMLDGGLIFGCMGMHGGLVGVWFLAQSITTYSDNSPAWLIGPGSPNPNPIGGLFAIFILLILILFQYRQLRAIPK